MCRCAGACPTAQTHRRRATCSHPPATNAINQLKCRNFKASASYIKSFLRQGQALLGLGRSREAAAALDAGAARAGTGSRRSLRQAALHSPLTLPSSRCSLPNCPPISPSAGLRLDPFNPDLKLALQEAQAAVLRDLAAGRARQARALEAPEPRQLISYHP